MSSHKPKVFWVNLNITTYQKFTHTHTPQKKGRQKGHNVPFSHLNEVSL